MAKDGAGCSLLLEKLRELGGNLGEDVSEQIDNIEKAVFYFNNKDAVEFVEREAFKIFSKIIDSQQNASIVSKFSDEAKAIISNKKVKSPKAKGKVIYNKIIDKFNQIVTTNSSQFVSSVENILRQSVDVGGQKVAIKHFLNGWHSNPNKKIYGVDQWDMFKEFFSDEPSKGVAGEIAKVLKETYNRDIKTPSRLRKPSIARSFSNNMLDLMPSAKSVLRLGGKRFNQLLRQNVDLKKTFGVPKGNKIYKGMARNIPDDVLKKTKSLIEKRKNAPDAESKQKITQELKEITAKYPLKKTYSYEAPTKAEIDKYQNEAIGNLYNELKAGGNTERKLDVIFNDGDSRLAWAKETMDSPFFSFAITQWQKSIQESSVFDSIGANPSRVFSELKETLGREEGGHEILKQVEKAENDIARFLSPIKTESEILDNVQRGLSSTVSGLLLTALPVRQVSELAVRAVRGSLTGEGSILRNIGTGLKALAEYKSIPPEMRADLFRQLGANMEVSNKIMQNYVFDPNDIKILREGVSGKFAEGGEWINRTGNIVSGSRYIANAFKAIDTLQASNDLFMNVKNFEWDDLSPRLKNSLSEAGFNDDVWKQLKKVKPSGNVETSFGQYKFFKKKDFAKIQLKDFSGSEAQRIQAVSDIYSRHLNTVGSTGAFLPSPTTGAKFRPNERGTIPSFVTEVITKFWSPAQEQYNQLFKHIYSDGLNRGLTPFDFARNYRSIDGVATAKVITGLAISGVAYEYTRDFLGGRSPRKLDAKLVGSGMLNMGIFGAFSGLTSTYLHTNDLTDITGNVPVASVARDLTKGLTTKDDYTQKVHLYKAFKRLAFPANMWYNSTITDLLIRDKLLGLDSLTTGEESMLNKHEQEHNFLY